MKLFRALIVPLILVIAFSLAAQTVSANILQTGPLELGVIETASSNSNSNLAAFAHSVQNGKPGQVTGLYVQGVLAFPVVQQPFSDASYVSELPDTITQFRMAAQYHTIGLLAHDYLAGAFFPKLHPGSEIVVVFGDGRLKKYQVYEVQKYQALSPSNPYSSFVDLSDQKTFSADQLFYHTYGLGNDTLVLQSCISTPSIPSWGRIFILAHPVETSHSTGLMDTVSLLERALTGTAAQ
jgi:hypothetical protein